MHTFCFSLYVSVSQHKVIDFLASAEGSVLLNVMALTGDIPQTRETVLE